MADKEPQPAPSIPELCFDAPLYLAFLLGPSVTERGRGDPTLDSLRVAPPPRQVGFPEQLAMHAGKTDRYCVECGRESTFLGLVAIIGGSAASSKTFRCQRDEKHFASFYFRHDSTTIMKVGQWPSIKDMQAGALGAFRKELGDEFGRELSTALGLFSHGVGIGSFVYLRRIFESLLREAEAQALAADLKPEALEGLRTGERIKLLKDYLPATMVKHAALYGILSKHIHELSEKECNENFGLVRQGIEMILSERIEAKAKAAREKAFGTDINELIAKMIEEQGG